jgi:hypothetical protein
MKQFSPQEKHSILLHYQRDTPTQSFASLAFTHNVKGGRKTVQRWHERWNGTVESLQHKKGAGRPRALSKAQVTRSVKPRILGANRNHRAVHYTSILPAVREATRTQVSIQTLRRYGKEELNAHNKRTIKRTNNERESQ